MPKEYKEKVASEWDNYSSRYDGLHGIEADEVAKYWLSKLDKVYEMGRKSMRHDVMKMVETGTPYMLPETQGRFMVNLHALKEEK